MCPQSSDSDQVLLRVKDLRVGFPIQRGILKRTVGHLQAVNGISIELNRGETLGLVGESGSGKTTYGRAILRLLPPEAKVEGTVEFDGADLLDLDGKRLRAARKRAQMVFQDPYGSLNPRMRVHDILGDPLEIHGLTRGEATKARVEELLRLVGLDADMRSRYPHSFSGGQRQRIAIARALALDPDFIVCDEPVTALDVSVQAQILNLLAQLQEQLGLSFLFIAHDLGVVRHMSDRVGVMYLGTMMEIGPARSVYESPAHPYTHALLSAIPVADPAVERQKQRIIMEGDIPSPASPPAGCRFHNRCWLYEKLDRPDECRNTPPELRPSEGGTDVACHFAEETSSLRPLPMPTRSEDSP